MHPADAFGLGGLESDAAPFERLVISVQKNKGIKTLTITTGRNAMVIRATTDGQAEDGFTLGIAAEPIVDVPVETLHDHLRFLQEHDLWGEATDALKEAGISTTPMSLQTVHVISELVVAKVRQLRRKADDPDAVVSPRCRSGNGGDAGGGGDGGGGGGGGGDAGGGGHPR